MQKHESEIMYLKIKRKRELISLLWDILGVVILKRERVSNKQGNLHESCLVKGKHWIGCHMQHFLGAESVKIRDIFIRIK